MKSKQWAEEIQAFSKFCGPACVAAALGISRGEATDRMLEQGVGADHPKGWTDIKAIGEILGAPVEKQSLDWVAGSERIRFTDRFPTVTQWLAEHKERVAVIRASNHLMYVGFGRVLESNGVRLRKGRVTHAVFLDTERES